MWPDQNREPNTTENRLSQAQAIMTMTRVMGRLVLLNRFMAFSKISVGFYRS